MHPDNHWSRHVRPERLDRRTVLAGLAAAAAAGSARAGHPTIPYGAAINHYLLPNNAAYRAALARHCDVLVAEGAMKWDAIRPTRETFNFNDADACMAFARTHGLQMRGHTLVWCEGNPAWLKTLGSGREAERELRRHIERTVTHFGTTIRDWDVVNEPIAERPKSAADLRGGVWPALLGPRYIDMAFHMAADIAPAQRRVLNEYDIEGATPRDRLKREALRRLILDLKSRGVPITGVGLQAHLNGRIEIDKEGVSAFCAEMTRAGLDILITELDVNDYDLPGDHTQRDAIVANRTEDFLSAIFAACRPKLVCTWGITDRQTWMPIWFKRSDGLPNRPLPLDAEFAEKPMLRVIRRFVGGV